MYVSISPPFNKGRFGGILYLLLCTSTRRGIFSPLADMVVVSFEFLGFVIAEKAKKSLSGWSRPFSFFLNFGIYFDSPLDRELLATFLE